MLLAAPRSALGQLPDFSTVPAPPLPQAPPGANVPATPTSSTPASASEPAKPKDKQAGQAQVYGSVTDQSGAVLTGVNVSLTDAHGGQHSATSNERGQYAVNLPPGGYTLLISIKGFKDFRTEGLTLAA